MCDSEISELQAGSIVVTSKDGSSYCLYSSVQVEKQAEGQEEKHEEATAAEPEVHDVAKMTEWKIQNTNYCVAAFE